MYSRCYKRVIILTIQQFYGKLPMSFIWINYEICWCSEKYMMNVWQGYAAENKFIFLYTIDGHSIWQSVCTHEMDIMQSVSESVERQQFPIYC